MGVEIAVSGEGLEPQIATATLRVEVGGDCQRLDQRRLARTVVTNENRHGAQGEIELLDGRQLERVRRSRCVVAEPNRTQERRMVDRTHYSNATCPDRAPDKPVYR